MATSSTSAENPVNQIASLLSEVDNANLEPPEKVEPDTEVTDESQSQESVEDESLAVEEPDESLEEEGVDSINDLATELDIPIEDMYALNFKMSKGDAVTLGSLKDFYENNKDIDSLREGITKREQDLETRQNEVSEIPQVSNELMQARAQVLSIQDQYNRTDWNGLRFNQPAEYAALQSDFRAQFDIAKNNELLATQKFDEHKDQSRRQQVERLYESMPELKDETVRTKVELEVQAYAAKYGFTAKDVANIEDSRLMRLLIESSRLVQAKVKAKEKQEDKLPVSASPTPRKSMPGRKAALKRLTEKAKASGQVRDQVSAVAALLGSQSS